MFPKSKDAAEYYEMLVVKAGLHMYALHLASDTTTRNRRRRRAPCASPASARAPTTGAALRACAQD